jgi:hypothetical protein
MSGVGSAAGYPAQAPLCRRDLQDAKRPLRVLACMPGEARPLEQIGLAYFTRLAVSSARPPPDPAELVHLNSSGEKAVSVRF